MLLLALTVFAGLQAIEANRRRQDAVPLGVTAEQQRQEADRQRQGAEAQRQQAVSRQLVAQAGNPETPPDVALLLVVEANRISDQPDVRGGLLKALVRSTPNRTYAWSIGNQQGWRSVLTAGPSPLPARTDASSCGISAATIRPRGAGAAALDRRTRWRSVPTARSSPVRTTWALFSSEMPGPARLPSPAR